MVDQRNKSMENYVWYGVWLRACVVTIICRVCSSHRSFKGGGWVERREQEIGIAGWAVQWIEGWNCIR
jgi:hypothetical protein